MGYKSKFKGAEIDAHLEKMVNVTYAELVALRDEGKLIAGQMYRMTDYETTCTWENTQVAGHPFDLVLTALDNKTLDEKCSAIWSERDTDGYFANSNLPAWDVRYCLDNDTNRFDWALMGGTVLKVSAMGQEFEAVDFVQSVVIDGMTYYLWALIMDGVPGLPVLSKTPVPKVGDELYISMDGATISGTAQVIDSYEKVGGKGVIYRLIDEHNNDVCYDFKNVMFLLPLTDGVIDANSSEYVFCYTFTRYNSDTSTMKDSSNEFDSCRNNKIGYHSYYNVFFNYCVDNSIGDFCDGNILYNCSNNSFANMCCGNLLMQRSNDNTFGIICCDNTLEADNSENVFGSNCKKNILSSRTSVVGKGNTFGIFCSENFLGRHCSNNTFGDNCHNINLGNNCSNNTFGQKCYNINFGESAEELHDYYQFNTFMGDNHDIDFYYAGTGVAGSKNQVQYYIFTNGAREVSLATNVISADRNNSEATYVIGVRESTIPRSVKLSDLIK